MSAEAKSICRCGHAGDADVGRTALMTAKKEVQHAGVLGHGPCTVKGCDCVKFTWASWAPWLTWEQWGEASRGVRR